MTPQAINAVKSSFALVVPNQQAVAATFYARLFELDPGLRALFKGDMTAQGQKLMTMLRTAVNALDRLETIVPAVQSLGRRHVAYGVKPEHYATVGAALLWTLEQGLGDKFDPETRAAWTQVYGVLADTMKAAAATAQ